MKESNDTFCEEMDGELETITFSHRFKRKMNRLFREVAEIENIPHPDVDNPWERLKSRVQKKIKNAKEKRRGSR